MWLVYLKNSLLAVLVIIIYSSCKKNTDDIINIYLASSLATLADTIKAQAAQEKIAIDLVFLSSSAIAKQVEQGAPCDAVILADDQWSKRLIKSGYVGSHVRIMASNELVLATLSKTASKHDFKSALDHIGAAEKLIIADPNYVPLGAYTKEALEKLGMFTKLSGQFIYAHSARQASMLLKQGIGQWAILYRTDAMSENAYIVADVDISLHRPVNYPFLVCKNARMDRVKVLEKILFSRAFNDALVAKGFALGRYGI